MHEASGPTFRTAREALGVVLFCFVYETEAYCVAQDGLMILCLGLPKAQVTAKAGCELYGKRQDRQTNKNPAMLQVGLGVS